MGQNVAIYTIETLSLWDHYSILKFKRINCISHKQIVLASDLFIIISYLSCSSDATQKYASLVEIEGKKKLAINISLSFILYLLISVSTYWLISLIFSRHTLPPVFSLPVACFLWSLSVCPSLFCISPQGADEVVLSNLLIWCNEQFIFQTVFSDGKWTTPDPENYKETDTDWLVIFRYNIEGTMCILLCQKKKKDFIKRKK